MVDAPYLDSVSEFSFVGSPRMRPRNCRLLELFRCCLDWFLMSSQSVLVFGLEDAPLRSMVLIFDSVVAGGAPLDEDVAHSFSIRAFG